MGLPRDLRSVFQTWDVPLWSNLVSFCCLQAPPHSLSMYPVLSSLSFLLSHSRASATFLSRLVRKQISVIAVYLLTQQDAPIRLLSGSPSQTMPRD